ncbi:DUF5678 domain-containing protein [candidate division KSB1 bacterium]|nr:DUF5678 domain-containing protein [candidate division KSB1 bacterium]
MSIIFPETDEVSLLSELEEAAESKNYKAFEHLAKSLDYSEYGSAALRQTLDLALSLDMVPLARELAQKGLCLYPQEKAFQQAAAVLAPPEIIGTQPAKPSNLALSQEWLKSNAAQYKGKWVAVGDGKLLGAAAKFKELQKQIEGFGKTVDTIIVKVLA